MPSIQGPIICAVIGRTRHKMMQIEIQEAAKQGAKMIELRLDFLAKAPDFKRLLEHRPCPLLATIRRPSDGGRYPGTEDERLMLIRQAVVAGFDWIDLETDIADQVRRFGKVGRIVSYHNMLETPDDLEQLYEKMCGQDADVVKIAVSAQKPGDNLRVIRLLKNAKKPTVALCMGDLGTCSRLLSAKFGAPFTYAVFNKERSVAPGILSFSDLKTIYRFEEIRPETKVFGVIGDPVGHSLSPLLHNSAMKHVGFDGLYLPFRVPRGELQNFLTQFNEVPIEGYSVTIPHKEAAAKAATQPDASVTGTGAANTLIRIADGWMASNTDSQAAIESLRAALPPQAGGSLAGRSVLILGAGGVSRALAHVLLSEQVQLTVTNRTAERAETLAKELGCKSIPWETRHNVLCDILVNGTSVGMHPNLDDSPIHASFLKPGLMVFETIYTPETTMLVREARARGCQVLTGVDMFVRQAALQFSLFTNQEAPLEFMYKTVRRALSPVHVPDRSES